MVIQFNFVRPTSQNGRNLSRNEIISHFGTSFCAPYFWLSFVDDMNTSQSLIACPYVCLWYSYITVYRQEGLHTWSHSLQTWKSAFSTGWSLFFVRTPFISGRTRKEFLFSTLLRHNIAGICFIIEILVPAQGCLYVKITDIAILRVSSVCSLCSR